MNEHYFVYITCSDRNEAYAIGKKLLERRLAGCINILNGMESMYHWNGTIEEATEVVLLVKTNQLLLESLTETVKKLHSYSTPCIAAIQVDHQNKDYSMWLSDNLKTD